MDFEEFKYNYETLGAFAALRRAREAKVSQEQLEIWLDSIAGGL